MKKIIIISILAILTSFLGTVTASDYPDEYLGLPGDNLNLYATMKLFQESETLEGFERSLNDQNSHINNLDLNGDNLVDYISVTDYVDGDVHTIVLRTQLNNNETQDIAVFTVQRFDDGTAQIQLIGDEALYGKNYIVEPIYADRQETPNPGYMGSTVVVTTPAPVAVTTYEVAAWPIIRFIYRPGYVCWHSAWSWGYYPSYWNPWRPYYWHTYWGYHRHFNNYYYAHYHFWNHYRYQRYHDFYYSRVRSYSPHVSARIREGNYRTTYSRPDLRSRGDDLYKRTVRRSTDYRTNNANTGRTNNPQAVRSRATYNSNSNSGRRTVSGNSSRTQTSSINTRGTEYPRKSSTIRSERSTANPYRGTRNTVSQRGDNSSSSAYRAGTGASARVNREAPQKSTTIRNSRTSETSSARQSYRQPKRSSSVYSNKSATKPSVSTRSSSSRSSYRQPSVSSRSRSSSSRSIRQPSVSSSSRSSGSRSSSVGRSSRSTGSRSSGVTSRSSHSRSSSGSRSGRR